MHSKRKGYRAERKIRMLLEKSGWVVTRAGASLGEADLVCLKDKKCILLQIKSTSKKTFYYYGYNKPMFQGFPFFIVVDFGYGKIKISPPTRKINIYEGEDLEEFLRNY